MTGEPLVKIEVEPGSALSNAYRRNLDGIANLAEAVLNDKSSRDSRDFLEHTLHTIIREARREVYWEDVGVLPEEWMAAAPTPITHLCCATNCDGNPCWCPHRPVKSIRKDILAAYGRKDLGMVRRLEHLVGIHVLYNPSPADRLE